MNEHGRAAQPNPIDDHTWETQDAPKISTTRMTLTVLVFVAWLAFLAWMAARRWFGSLL